MKKSFNLDTDLEDVLEKIIRTNRGVTLTMIFNQALRVWLRNPNVQFNGRAVELPRSEPRGPAWGDLSNQLNQLS